MGIYLCAVDKNSKTKIEPPKGFPIKGTAIFAPGNPFPAMVMMMNYYGYNYELINDIGRHDEYYGNEYIDITDEVFEKYRNKFVECE